MTEASGRRDPAAGDVQPVVEVFSAPEMGDPAKLDPSIFTSRRQIEQIDGEGRTDVMRRQDGLEVALPVMGVFEVRDGRIAAWRDYFDMGMVAAAFE